MGSGPLAKVCLSKAVQNPPFSEKPLNTGDQYPTALDAKYTFCNKLMVKKCKKGKNPQLLFSYKKSSTFFNTFVAKCAC